MAFGPVKNLRATPLPQFTPWGAGSLPMLRLNPRANTDVPLPRFNPYSAVFNAPVYPFTYIPVKPLPGDASAPVTYSYSL